jgi:hypothetical protein
VLRYPIVFKESRFQFFKSYSEAADFHLPIFPAIILNVAFGKILSPVASSIEKVSFLTGERIAFKATFGYVLTVNKIQNAIRRPDKYFTLFTTRAKSALFIQDQQLATFDTLADGHEFLQIANWIWLV